jgi:hypothetical protein
MGRRGSGGEEEGKGQAGNSGGFRIPAILMVPVGAIVGWLVGNWPGAILGGVIGIFLWRSRV